jgi:radical SAM superfamily enzyme YgiQ (UPF0313 family)
MFKTLLVTPPFIQVNTPYPSTIYLAGYLKSKGYEAKSFDLSLNVFLKIFSKSGLTKIFNEINNSAYKDDFIIRALSLQDKYINTIEPVINYLQGRNPNLAYRIVGDNFIPQGESFTRQINESEAFGYFGLQDKAKYYSSLMIDDLTAIIRKTITPHFGLSRYAENIAVSPPIFDPILNELNRPLNIIEKIIVEETEKVINYYQPGLIGYTIPFPGNLLGALISSKFIRENYPEIKIILGGGYINTELRSLSDKRIFNYADFITYDDGELPIYNIVKNLEGKNQNNHWVRTLLLKNNEIEYLDNAVQKTINHNDLLPPSIDGLEPDKYVAITEMLNPMHRIWSDGYWNKLMVAHGCYWSKCTFCDVALDYIGRYSPANAQTIVNWMEDMIAQTGRTSFHFTDEAAPPSVLRELSIELIKRKLPVSWWGNIRYEKAFTKDLCRLMAASGCVAVSGGLEVADERLLKLINKGVTLEQAAKVCRNFRDSGIMAHSYLMYGFPSQTEQEIINSLELVRQFIKLDLFQSGFWHLFTLTTHSPIAKNTESFHVKVLSSSENPFANDNLEHYDMTGINYKSFTSGLNKALYNFMHGVGLDLEVNEWFDFNVPDPTVSRDLINNFLSNTVDSNKNELNANIIWLCCEPIIKILNDEESSLSLHTDSLKAEWFASTKIVEWIKYISEKCRINNGNRVPFYELAAIFPGNETEFNDFINSEVWKELKDTAVLLL